MKGKNVISSGSILKNLVTCTPLLSKRVTPNWQPLQSDSSGGDEPEAQDEPMVPQDVTEGHFAVLASSGEEDGKMLRFVIGLNHLRNPGFLRLLDQTQEEYGFRNDGVLVVPCKAEELEKILTGSDY